MGIDITAIQNLFGQRTRQWRFVRGALLTNQQISDGTLGTLDTPLKEEENLTGFYDQNDLRRGLGTQLAHTDDFKRDLDDIRRRQGEALRSILTNDVPKMILSASSSRDAAGVLSELDAEMRRTSDSVKTNTVSVTAPTASANNALANSTVMFGSISRVHGTEDITVYEAAQSVASGTFFVGQTSFDGLNGRHRFDVHANRGIVDDFDEHFLPRPVTFSVTATRETHETAATATPSRSAENMVGGGTLKGSSASVFGWTVSGTMFTWNTTSPLGTSPKMNASSFLFSGGALAVATTLRQSIPFQNASSTKFVIGDVTFCGFSYRMSGNTTGSVKVWFEFTGGDARIVTLTSTSNGTTWRTSGGFIHAGRNTTGAVVRMTATSDFDGRCWIGDVCWSKVAPNPTTGLLVVPRRAHNQSRVGDRWEGGATANNEAGRIQAFLARTFGRGLPHSASPTISDPT